MATMPTWILCAALASLCFGGHYLTLRAASGRIDDSLGGFLLEATAAIGLLVLMFVGPKTTTPNTTMGFVWSSVSGLFITGGVVLLFAALRLGGPVSGTGTIALGGGVALAALFAPLFFDEALSARRIIGIVLGALAMVVLATEKPTH